MQCFRVRHKITTNQSPVWRVWRSILLWEEIMNHLTCLQVLMAGNAPVCRCPFWSRWWWGTWRSLSACGPHSRTRWRCSERRPQRPADRTSDSWRSQSPRPAIGNTEMTSCAIYSYIDDLFLQVFFFWNCVKSTSSRTQGDTYHLKKSNIQCSQI